MMKKLLLLLMVAALLVGCDGTPSTKTWPLQQPESSYEIDAWGTNPDILEFTPKGQPDYLCILAVSGMDELKTMFCVPKATITIAK
jgi:hypothetical protein